MVTHILICSIHNTCSYKQFNNTKCVLFVITFALLPIKSNAAVILDTFNIEYSDIYSSYVDLWFDDTVYNDGNYVLSGPSINFINQQYGGRIDSLSSW